MKERINQFAYPNNIKAAVRLERLNRYYRVVTALAFSIGYYQQSTAHADEAAISIEKYIDSHPNLKEILSPILGFLEGEFQESYSELKRLEAHYIKIYSKESQDLESKIAILSIYEFFRGISTSHAELFFIDKCCNKLFASCKLKFLMRNNTASNRFSTFNHLQGDSADDIANIISRIISLNEIHVSPFCDIGSGHSIIYLEALALVRYIKTKHGSTLKIVIWTELHESQNEAIEYHLLWSWPQYIEIRRPSRILSEGISELANAYLTDHFFDIENPICPLDYIPESDLRIYKDIRHGLPDQSLKKPDKPRIFAHFRTSGYKVNESWPQYIRNTSRQAIVSFFNYLLGCQNSNLALVIPHDLELGQSFVDFMPSSVSLCRPYSLRNAHSTLRQYMHADLLVVSQSGPMYWWRLTRGRMLIVNALSTHACYTFSSSTVIAFKKLRFRGNSVPKRIDPVELISQFLSDWVESDIIKEHFDIIELDYEEIICCLQQLESNDTPQLTMYNLLASFQQLAPLIPEHLKVSDRLPNIASVSYQNISKAIDILLQ